jgi:hypothetical protein
VWRAFESTGEYRRWWPWLRELDADGLHPGATWHCTVRPPLPYVVRFCVHVDDVEVPTSIVTHVSGDVRGVAQLVLEADGDDATTVRLTATLDAATRWLGALARLAPPVARFGHDWVLDTGARQFAQHLTSARGA